MPPDIRMPCLSAFRPWNALAPRQRQDTMSSVRPLWRLSVSSAPFGIQGTSRAAIRGWSTTYSVMLPKTKRCARECRQAPMTTRSQFRSSAASMIAGPGRWSPGLT